MTILFIFISHICNVRLMIDFKEIPTFLTNQTILKLLLLSKGHGGQLSLQTLGSSPSLCLCWVGISKSS